MFIDDMLVASAWLLFDLVVVAHYVLGIGIYGNELVTSADPLFVAGKRSDLATARTLDRRCIWRECRSAWI
jgi:hypothetical protein